MRYLGIDYGSKKVGVALSDEAGTMGFPHAVLPNSSRLAYGVAELIKERGVEAVVIGESRDFYGKENALASGARDFAARLKELANVTVHFEPETLTTQEARRYPDGTRMPGSPDVDASAAALILTRFLERSGGV